MNNMVTQKLDELNRIVLPASIKSLGWTDRTAIDFVVQEDGDVLLRPHRPFCGLCGETDAD